MIEVAGLPLIDHALALVRAAGVRRIVVNTHAHPDQMHAHLARVAPEALISHEPVRLETGGGLKQALPLLGPGPVFTLNADMVWRGPNPLTALAAAWRPGDGALLALVPRAGANGHGGPGDFFLEPGGHLRRRGAADTADFVYAGAQIIDPTALDGFPDGAFSLNGVWDALIAEGRAARDRASGRLGRRRPARGHRARRGGARAVTRLFAPTEGPRVFALAPGVDFSRALVAGLEARLAGQPPEAIARVEIWVNTRRAARALTTLLAAGPARLLPRIRVVTELATDPLGPLDLGPPVPELRRRLELARLVGALADAEPHLASGTAVFELADSLAELLDELEGEGIAPAAFAGVEAGEHAAHWQRSLRFLGLLEGYLAAAGPGSGQGRMRAAAEALAAAWALDPPPHPVIVAGSTGSRGATRAFMAAVARLPQGAVVLPGLDAGLPPAVWQRLGADDPGAADHPQHGFRGLADALGFDPAAVPGWHPAPPPSPERNALVSLALRPAPVTDQWRSEGAALAGTLAAACAGLAWVEAPDPRGEALAIALRLREAAETGERAALVTPDRTLARRVTAELGRWGLIPDDSAGRPLAQTPPGVLLRRLAELPGTRPTPADLLVLAKHPLVSSAPGARREHLRLTARLETRRLRGGAPWIDWDDLAALGGRRRVARRRPGSPGSAPRWRRSSPAARCRSPGTSRATGRRPRRWPPGRPEARRTGSGRRRPASRRSRCSTRSPRRRTPPMRSPPTSTGRSSPR